MYGENMRSPDDWRNDPAAVVFLHDSTGSHLRPTNEFIHAVQVDAWNAAIETAAVELWKWAQKMQHNKQWDVERELLCDACEEIRALRKGAEDANAEK